MSIRQPIRGILALPGSVLLICLFLPALKVCDRPTAPIEFPPCYAAYLGGIGIVIMGLARDRRALAVGASITPLLALLTVGGCLMVGYAFDRHDTLVHLIGIAIGAVSIGLGVGIVRGFVRRPPRDSTMAWIVVFQGIGSSIWAAMLAFDRDGLWGSDVALIDALAIVVVGILWLRASRDAPPDPPELPRATARET